MLQITPRFQASREGLLRFSSVADNQVLLYTKNTTFKIKDTQDCFEAVSVFDTDVIYYEGGQ